MDPAGGNGPPGRGARRRKATRSRQAMGVEFESSPANAHAEIQRFVQLMGSDET
jgi:hypothetical protein